VAAVIVYPAIDLKQGQCVRLKRGEMASATVFNADPAAQAALFAGAGFSWLHCVDLDGAFEGRSVNTDAIKSIRARINLPIQLGGGIRTRASIEGWLDAGITRVVLGTAALRDPELVRAAARDFPGRIAVGVDARDGWVAVEGWAETSELTALDLARRFEDAGVAALIFTDVSRDGMLAGANVEATQALAAAVTIPVIASGGVSSLADVEALQAAGTIAGVIVGRALYDGAVSAQELLGMTA
jgi:phosphoribosylformimino-5-aminoimidazole carboxamide ribotide isomerase